MVSLYPTTCFSCISSIILRASVFVLRLYSLECAVLIPLMLPALTLAVSPFARAFVLLGKLSILVVLETPLARLLDLTPMVSTHSAYLRKLACLAIDKPTNVVIGEALRDAPGEHAFQLEAQTCRTDTPKQNDSLPPPAVP